MSSSIKDLLESTFSHIPKNSEYSVSQKDLKYCLANIIRKKKEFLITNPEYILSISEEKVFLKSVKLLNEGIPLAYVIGNQEFYGYKYSVNKNVLIPRPETEIIIPKILQYGDSVFKKKNNILLIDAGSGSGCIGLTIAGERPSWKILLTEKSLKAIDVLRENCHKYKYKNCSIIASDWLKGLNKNIADIIISNPPYIEHGTSQIDNTVFKYEPHSSLFSSDRGLKDIKTLIFESKLALVKGGFLFMENGLGQSEDIIRNLKENYYEDIDIILDYNNIKRFTVSRNS